MRILLCSVIIYLMPVMVLAASAQFSIEQTLTGDVVSPTTPAPLTATTVGTTQINLTWGASSDSTGIGGYVVYRDTSAIATTTLLSFSDTGLIASTTYSYYVVAFDNSGLYSSSSATVVATTEGAAVIVSEEEDSSQVGSVIFPELRNFDVSTSEFTARIAWGTNIPARYFLRWGRTDQYEIGGVQNELFRRSHETLITGLEPGVTYYYELAAINRRGDVQVLAADSFTTIAPPDVTAPPNVALFTARAAGQSVELSWRLPRVSDVEKVRIVRNHLFIPTDPHNGFVLFEGLLEEFIDTDAFVGYGRQYYTIYTYDSTGNRSSGAVAIAVFVPEAGAASTDGATQPLPVPNNEAGTTSPAESGVITELYPETFVPSSGVERFSFNDLWFWQYDRLLAAIDDTVTLSADSSFTVGVDVSFVPDRFRSMTIRFTNEHRSAAYLFELAGNEKGYETVIETLAPGEYETEVTLTALTNRHYLVATGTTLVTTETGFVSNQPIDFRWIWQLLVICLGIMLLFVLLRKRRQQSEYTEE